MKYSLNFIVFLFIIICDTVTKQWALHYCVAPREYGPFITCELVFNRGISWGIFNNESSSFMHLLIPFISLFIILILGIYMFRRARNGYPVLGELLVFSGACGNMIDRCLYSGVVDFIGLHYGPYYWAFFNIADMCIVSGIGIMIIYSMNEKYAIA